MTYRAFIGSLSVATMVKLSDGRLLSLHAWRDWLVALGVIDQVMTGIEVTLVFP